MNCSPLIYAADNVCTHSNGHCIFIDSGAAKCETQIDAKRTRPKSGRRWGERRKKKQLGCCLLALRQAADKKAHRKWHARASGQNNRTQVSKVNSVDWKMHGVRGRGAAYQSAPSRSTGFRARAHAIRCTFHKNRLGSTINSQRGRPTNAPPPFGT